ncbi:MAG: extracellular solute-binding protein, partial [Treponema sp.]|nr:extracellular solute-binding protein [Treponema sp.]
TCLEDLTKDIYKKKLILMDARTSTPGLGFETWVNKVYGSKAADYMKRLEPSILTMAPGWSVGYGMFTDGHVMQVEGAGLVKGAKNADGAKRFIEFLISEEAQNVIPTTQWMYPSNKNVKLPACYDTIEMPEILK